MYFKGTAKIASRGDGSGAPALPGARPLLAQTEKESPDDDGWRHRIDARFTSLRGYAALAVMLAHYQYLGFLAAAPVLKYSAQLELMLFFFLSSFLLSHSLASDPDWTKVSIFPVASYAINRVFRIFPLLFIVVTFCWRWSLAFFPASTTLAQALALSVTLGKAPSVLWTIPVELTFYVFLPVCLRHFLRLTRSPLGAGALTALFAAWCVCIAVARRYGVPAEVWMTLGFHHYANTFVGGVLLYALLANGHIAIPRAGAAIADGAPALFLLAYPFVSRTLFAGDFRMTELDDRAAWQAYYDLIFPFAPFLVGGIVYGLLHPSRTLLSTVMRAKFLRRSGDISFGVYLIHIPMIEAFGSRYGYGDPQFLAAAASTLAVASVLSATVERPAIALGREIGRRLRGSQDSAARGVARPLSSTAG